MEFIKENQTEQFKKWLSVQYPNLCPYFVLDDDEENEIIINEFKNYIIEKGVK